VYDALELFFTLIVNWRMGLSVLVSAVLAIVLTQTVSWITGGYGLLMVLVGFCFSWFWHASSESKVTAKPPGDAGGV